MIIRLTRRRPGVALLAMRAVGELRVGELRVGELRVGELRVGELGRRAARHGGDGLR